jgi:hypothetical protein
MILRKAHGAAADGGSLIVAEDKPLDEYPKPDVARTVTGLTLRRVRGRPFQVGNSAAAGRGPSLSRITIDPHAPEERQRAARKATSLQRARIRELEVQYGGTLSSGVRTELKAWALDAAAADLWHRAGDDLKAAALNEKASGHQLKAVGLAEREAQARPRGEPAWRTALLSPLPEERDTPQ